MRTIRLLAIASLLSTSSFAQFKNDNVLYHTVYPEELCNALRSAKNYLLLDVRSPGEYSDTSSGGLNIGRLDKAININVRELGPRIGELKEYKDKPIFVYCSHSQRSRRASKMLSDSGFTNVININGGVTALRQLPDDDCINKVLQSKMGYSFISAVGLCNRISNHSKEIFLLDVRSDSAYRHIDKDPEINAFGIIKNSVNIPLASLKERLKEIPTDKEIIVMDIFGDDAEKAAVMLHENKYQRVSLLLEGLERVFFMDSKGLGCLAKNYVSTAKFKILSSPDFKRITDAEPGFLPLDVRSADEFSNKHKDYWRNIGHVNNAINIPVGDLPGKIAEIEKYKNKPVVVYAFSGSKDSYDAANILVANGFTNVNVLVGGLFNVRWTAGNVKGFEKLAALVVDVPVSNQ